MANTPIIEHRAGACSTFIDQWPPVRQDPQTSALTAIASGAGAQRRAGFPGLRGAGQQPPAQGNIHFGPWAPIFASGRTRYCQPAVRGTRVHQQIDCQDTRTGRAGSRCSMTPVHCRIPPGLAPRSARPQSRSPEGAAGSARISGGARAVPNDVRRAPVPDWEGGRACRRFTTAWTATSAATGTMPAPMPSARGVRRLPCPIVDDAEFMLHMMRAYDKGFPLLGGCGRTRTGEGVLPLLLDKNTLPGFNDSGAHITNMAFFDANLTSLKLAQQDSLATVSAMVRRLQRTCSLFRAGCGQPRNRCPGRYCADRPRGAAPVG